MLQNTVGDKIVFSQPMGRLLAIDYGSKRTGIAVTDEMQIIASGLTTVETKMLIPFLKTYCAAESVELFLIGLPKQMNNEPSESEPLILKFIDRLKKECFMNMTGFRSDHGQVCSSFAWICCSIGCTLDLGSAQRPEQCHVEPALSMPD